MTRTAPALVLRTRTGLLHTELTHNDGLYTWQHDLGPAAPLPFSTLRLQVDAHPDAGGVIAGHGDAAGRRYVIDSGTSMIQLLHTASGDRLQALGHAWADALRQLHAAVPVGPDAPRSAPRTALRAAAWLERGWEAATAILGGRGLRAIADWLERMVTAGHRVPVHGHPGLAHWIPCPTGPHGYLLTGEDTGFADPFYDYGWILGELAELHEFHPALREPIGRIRHGLLEHCPVGEPGDQALACAYRLVQHAYDWQHHAGASPAQGELLLRLAARYLAAAPHRETEDQ